jgi:hypothetical protein
MKLGNAAAQQHRADTNPNRVTIVEGVALHVRGEPGLHGPTTLELSLKNLKAATSFAIRLEDGEELYVGANQASFLASQDIPSFASMTEDSQNRAVLEWMRAFVGWTVGYKRPRNYVTWVRRPSPANTVMPLA